MIPQNLIFFLDLVLTYTNTSRLFTFKSIMYIMEFEIYVSWSLLLLPTTSKLLDNPYIDENVATSRGKWMPNTDHIRPLCYVVLTSLYNKNPESWYNAYIVVAKWRVAKCRDLGMPPLCHPYAWACHPYALRLWHANVVPKPAPFSSLAFTSLPISYINLSGMFLGVQ